MAPPLSERLSVVVLTHNRAHELLRTLEQLHALPEQPPLIVVDNASIDDTSVLVKQRFPGVRLIQSRINLGAAARNLGVEHVNTPYVAFCDDDTWWEAGALVQAADMLDANPKIAVLSARILVGRAEREDPTCALMAHSPLRQPDNLTSGRAILGFMAGASVFRRAAFIEAGGFEPNLFIGGEESLLAIDLATRGWIMAYAPRLVVHHYPSGQRDAQLRRKLVARNAIWVAWLRLPWRTALQQTMRILGRARRRRILWATMLNTLRGLPWALRNRQVVPMNVEMMYRQVQR